MSQDRHQAQPSNGATSKERTQYQHYIPRFILKNFAHRSEAPIPHRMQAKRRRRRRGKASEAPDMLHVLQLEPEVEKAEIPLDRAFGQWDMYRDYQQSANQQRIEKRLAQLECRVAPITHKVRKAQEQGRPTVELLRPERDELRKFLFVMKYRGSTQHKRFYNKDIDSYDANDKEHMIQYMREKGFQKPIDVWLDNIEAILDLKMDNEGNWPYQLMERMYPEDAAWAFANLQSMYLAFCTPANGKDEFLLTENAFSIHEGPVSSTINPFSGEKVAGAYTEYHNFAPISPKVMMVLRSTLLPNKEEDAIPGVREARIQSRQLHRMQHTDPDKTDSILEDLPVTKARNSYTQIINGEPFLVEGEDGTRRASHRFYFRLFPLSSEHVQKINAIVLNESYGSSMVAFSSPGATRTALECYLTDTCTAARVFPLKVVSSPWDPALRRLQKLEQAAKLLGSDVSAACNIDEDDWEAKLFEVMERMGRSRPEWSSDESCPDLTEITERTRKPRHEWSSDESCPDLNETRPKTPEDVVMQHIQENAGTQAFLQRLFELTPCSGLVLVTMGLFSFIFRRFWRNIRSSSESHPRLRSFLVRTDQVLQYVTEKKTADLYDDHPAAAKTSPGIEVWNVRGSFEPPLSQTAQQQQQKPTNTDPEMATLCLAFLATCATLWELLRLSAFILIKTFAFLFALWYKGTSVWAWLFIFIALCYAAAILSLMVDQLHADVFFMYNTHVERVLRSQQS